MAALPIPTVMPSNAGDSVVATELGVTTAGCVLVGITMVLRYLGRWALMKRVASSGTKAEKILGWDDIFNVLSFLCFLGLVIAVYISAHCHPSPVAPHANPAPAIGRGMGRHQEYLLFKHGYAGLSSYHQGVFVCSIFYNAVIGLIKLSVLCLYLRILRGVQSTVLPILVWSMVALVAINTTANVASCIFACAPIRGSWDVTLTTAKCINVNAFYVANAITGVLTDFCVYILSIPIVKPLQMDTRTKLQLLATMLVGGLYVAPPCHTAAQTTGPN